MKATSALQQERWAVLDLDCSKGKPWDAGFMPMYRESEVEGSTQVGAGRSGEKQAGPGLLSPLGES